MEANKGVIQVDAQQELFSTILERLKAEFESVYDGFLPPEGTEYPFIYLSNSTQTDATRAKFERMGTIYQTIDVWGNNPSKRGTISSMLMRIKSICAGIDRTDNFGWVLKSINQEILADASTKKPLMHGILELEFSFS